MYIDICSPSRTQQYSLLAERMMKPPITAAASAMVATLGFAVTGLVATTDRTGAFVHTSNIRACLRLR